MRDRTEQAAPDVDSPPEQSSSPDKAVTPWSQPADLDAGTTLGDDAGQSTPERVSSARGDVDDAADGVFDPTRVQTYEITVAPEDLARIDQHPIKEELISGSLVVNGQTYGPVGFRYKGSGGAFTRPCTAAADSGYDPGPKIGKCSMKLDFDEYDDNARFFGLKKLNLHSMGHDDSLMRERLGYALYRTLGVAAPRTAYARVLINGQLEGIFLAVEQVDGRFTRSRFGDGGEGNLYKEVWPLYDQPEPYRAALETNKGAATVVDKMVGFAAAVSAVPSGASAWLERKYMLSYMAVDRVILNDDGIFHWYCRPNGFDGPPIGNHNFYWYEDTLTDRMWLIPWDLDDSFGGDPRLFVDREWSADEVCDCHMGGGYIQRAPSCDPLIGELATWRADYDEVVDALIAGPFAEPTVDAQLATWAAQAGPVVDEAAGAHDAPDRATWEQALQAFREVVASARKNRGHAY